MRHLHFERQTVASMCLSLSFNKANLINCFLLSISSQWKIWSFHGSQSSQDSYCQIVIPRPILDIPLIFTQWPMGCGRVWIKKKTQT